MPPRICWFHIAQPPPLIFTVAITPATEYHHDYEHTRRRRRQSYAYWRAEALTLSRAAEYLRRYGTPYSSRCLLNAVADYADARFARRHCRFIMLRHHAIAIEMNITSSPTLVSRTAYFRKKHQLF